MQENYLKILLDTARIVRNSNKAVTMDALFEHSEVLRNCYEKFNIEGKLNQDDQAILRRLVERYINALLIILHHDESSWKKFIINGYNHDCISTA